MHSEENGLSLSPEKFKDPDVAVLELQELIDFGYLSRHDGPEGENTVLTEKGSQRLEELRSYPDFDLWVRDHAARIERTDTSTSPQLVLTDVTTGTATKDRSLDQSECVKTLKGVAVESEGEEPQQESSSQCSPSAGSHTPAVKPLRRKLRVRWNRLASFGGFAAVGTWFLEKFGDTMWDLLLSFL